MRRLALLAAFIPAAALAAVSGIDDIKPNIPQQTQETLDDTIETYYQQPSVAKVNTVLDIMNNSEVLRKKTSWPTFIGFFTVIFESNKNHIMGWITRSDYNTYAEDVIMAALMHAKLKESALVFAQAQQWKKGDIDRIRGLKDTTNLKKLNIVLPGHIDTLWGAFFASGDKVYVDEIIGVLFMTKLSPSKTVSIPAGHTMQDVLDENKRLAQSTLTAYALEHEAVRRAIAKRLAQEKDATKKKILERLLPTMSFPGKH